ncbi:MAG: nuclear transport factor 2 family protein, partial [Ignavibacteriae bacterium]|nr:nuclear transport factor 2 family protein [Ignavibacteriota bacterium]
ASAVAYYQAMNNKDLSIMEKYLHLEVRLISPLADITGKAAVLNSIKHFLAIFNTLTIRAKLGAGDQVMLAYDLDCPAPIGLYRGAVLLTFQEGLIIRYELFYDARPLEKKKDEIFTQS